MRNVTQQNDQMKIVHSTALGRYASHVYTNGVLRARPGTMIKNLSSHIPTFTRIEVQNISAILVLTRLNSHIGTGIKYPVKRKMMKSKFHGHWNICISRSASSGASCPYTANISSKNVNASQPVATTIRSLARASKCSGRMKSSHFQSHRIRAIIVTTADTPEWTAPMTK